jgi:hypothetical protein
MSTPFKADLTGDGRLEYQRRYLSGIRGEREPVIFSEQEFSTLEMPELDEHVNTTESAAVSKDTAGTHPYLARLNFILALALQRDARYAHVNRRFLFALGADNKLREDFEAFAAATRTCGSLV